MVQMAANYAEIGRVGKLGKVGKWGHSLTIPLELKNETENANVFW